MKKYILPIARLLVSWFGFNEKKHLKRSFSSLPGCTGLTLIDIGAAGGIEKRWQAITEDLIYYGFEPDKRSFEKLSSDTGARSMEIFPFALWSEEKEISVFLCRDPQCSSVYEPNRIFLDKFPIPERFDVIDNFSCNAKSLDQVQIQSPDFIKMDIQGAEFEVLKEQQTLSTKLLEWKLRSKCWKCIKDSPYLVKLQIT